MRSGRELGRHLAIALLLLLAFASPAAAMQIFVRDAITGQLLTVEAESSDTIDALKVKVQDLQGTPPEKQRLFYKGNMLEDGRTLADYNIKAADTLALYPTAPAAVEHYRPQLRRIIRAQAYSQLSASLSANEVFMQAARERLIHPSPAGTGWSLVPVWSRITDGNGLATDSGSLRLSGARHGGGALSGAFAQIDYARSGLSGDFDGSGRSWQAEAGLFGVLQLNDWLYADAFAALHHGRSRFSMENTIFSARHRYAVNGWQAGAALTGVIEAPGMQLRPTISAAFGASGISKVAYRSATLDEQAAGSFGLGNVSAGLLRFIPEIRFTPQADAVLALKPGLVCERRVLSGTQGDCGWSVAVTLGSAPLQPQAWQAHIGFSDVGAARIFSGGISYTSAF